MRNIETVYATFRAALWRRAAKMIWFEERYIVNKCTKILKAYQKHMHMICIFMIREYMKYIAKICYL